MRKKIAFVVHMLAPYRLSFYQKLFSGDIYEWQLFAGYKLKNDNCRPQYNGDTEFSLSLHREIVSHKLVYDEIHYDGMYESVVDYDPDVIIMFAHVGTESFRKIASWAKTRNIKLIMWTCFWEPDYISGYKKMIRDFVIRRFYNKADYHIAYSSLAKERLIRIGFPEEKIDIAFNGVDVSAYENVIQRNTVPKMVFDRKKINFLYVGGFGKDKKVHLLIKATIRCIRLGFTDIQVNLIGDGLLIDECKRLVKDLNLMDNIRFFGRITTELSEYINAADCIVLPGTGGLILNEAILFKKPFIVSEADGTEIDLLLNGYNGLKFQKNNADSLARAICEVAENLEFYKHNASHVPEVVRERSSVEKMVATFRKVVRKVTNETPNVSWRRSIPEDEATELEKIHVNS